MIFSSLTYWESVDTLWLYKFSSDHLFYASCFHSLLHGSRPAMKQLNKCKVAKAESNVVLCTEVQRSLFLSLFSSVHYGTVELYCFTDRNHWAEQSIHALMVGMWYATRLCRYSFKLGQYTHYLTLNQNTDVFTHF